jgi:membrane-associated phospholipid phosphatase
MRFFAKIISVLFHPLLLPTYAFILVIYSNPFLFASYENSKWIFVLRVFINTFVFPVISLLLLWRLGFIKNLEMSEKEDRIIPYIVVGTLYIWSFMTFRKSDDPQMLNIILLGSCFTLFASFFTNIFSKVSIHAAGMACFTAIALIAALQSYFDLRLLFMLIILLAGLTGTARLYLKAHSMQEVINGYFIGFAAQMIAMRFI